MKLFVSLSIILLSFCSISHGQDQQDPVDWSFEVEDHGDHYLMISTASIDESWSLYSQHTDIGGPVALSFEYDADDQLIGDTEEKSELIENFSKLFDLNVRKFKKEAIFHQKVGKNTDLKSIRGQLIYMCCDELRCLPPTVVEFDVAI